MPYRPGDRFGRYELVSRLGHGGMAETWRARLLGAAGVTKPVLIKKILPAYRDDEAFISMFITEARISASLSHGNIAQVHDFGEVDGEYFLAMEFVDGKPLDRIVKRAQRSGLFALPPPLATFIALEVCRGLHYAHTRADNSGKPLGIVHRDISPDNVLVSYEGQIKLVDFGIAKAKASALGTSTTAPGVVKGKYLFFSPEQARGEEVDARTDVWATGIVLYELLCGRLPVEGPEYAVIPKLINGVFPRPSDIRQDLPAELDAIIMRALALQPEKRFETSHAFGEALAGYLYTSTPRFSALTLSHFVQELFREDLTHEGRVVQVPDSFLEEMNRWKIPPTSVLGGKTLEVPALPRKVDPSSQDKTQPRRLKVIPRDAFRPTREVPAAESRTLDDDEEEEEADTRPRPVEEVDPIEAAETEPILAEKRKPREAPEARPLLAGDTQPNPPALHEPRRKERFWRRSLKALTLTAVASMALAIVLARQEPVRASPAEATPGSTPSEIPSPAEPPSQTAGTPSQEEVLPPAATPPGAPSDPVSPQAPTQPTGKSARSLAEDAYRLIEQLRYAEASAVLSRCLELEPTNSECRLLQTSVLSQLQQAAQEKDQRRQPVRRKPPAPSEAAGTSPPRLGRTSDGPP